MKKIISLILALAMVFSMAVMASAAAQTDTYKTADSTWTGSNASVGNILLDVTGATTPVYKVTVTWSTLEFEYAFDAGQWDPETHTYNAGNTGWNDATGTVNIANDSNATVYYKAEIVNQDVGGDAAIKWDDDTVAAKTGDLVSADTAAYINKNVRDNDTLTFKPTGTPGTDIAADTAFATITVTLGTSAF